MAALVHIYRKSVDTVIALYSLVKAGTKREGRYVLSKDFFDSKDGEYLAKASILSCNKLSATNFYFSSFAARFSAVRRSFSALAARATLSC